MTRCGDKPGLRPPLTRDLRRDYGHSTLGNIAHKRDNRRPFPTWSEVLEVLYSLGYRKVADATALPGLSPDGKKVPPKG